MDLRTPAGQKAMREAADAHHKWFMEEATPEEQDDFLDEIEGQYWDYYDGMPMSEFVQAVEAEIAKAETKLREVRAKLQESIEKQEAVEKAEARVAKFEAKLRESQTKLQEVRTWIEEAERVKAERGEK